MEDKYVTRLEHERDLNELRAEHQKDINEIKISFLSMKKDLGVIKWTLISIAGCTLTSIVGALLNIVIK